MPDVIEAAKDADILIFVVPHQFIRRICSTLQGKIKSTAVGLSLIKVYPSNIYMLKHETFYDLLLYNQFINRSIHIQNFSAGL